MTLTISVVQNWLTLLLSVCLCGWVLMPLIPETLKLLFHTYIAFHICSVECHRIEKPWVCWETKHAKKFFSSHVLNSVSCCAGSKSGSKSPSPPLTMGQGWFNGTSENILRQTQMALGLWEQLHDTAATPSTVVPPLNPSRLTNHHPANSAAWRVDSEQASCKVLLALHLDCRISAIHKKCQTTWLWEQCSWNIHSSGLKWTFLWRRTGHPA